MDFNNPVHQAIAIAVVVALIILLLWVFLLYKNQSQAAAYYERRIKTLEGKITEAEDKTSSWIKTSEDEYKAQITAAQDLSDKWHKKHTAIEILYQQALRFVAATFDAGAIMVDGKYIFIAQIPGGAQIRFPISTTVYHKQPGGMFGAGTIFQEVVFLPPPFEWDGASIELSDYRLNQYLAEEEGKATAKHKEKTK